VTAPLTGIQRVRLDTLAVQLDERRSHTKAADLRHALALIDTQAAVIARYRDGWKPGERLAVVMAGEPRPDAVSVWISEHLHRDSEPMTPAEQKVIYGEER